MRELHIVRDTYVEVLRGLYHPRIRYPEEKEAE
jgi:membrane-associated HD superfamily phosphohydrolase